MTTTPTIEAEISSTVVPILPSVSCIGNDFMASFVVRQVNLQQFASSTNASKESSPVEPAPNSLKELSEKKPPPSKETKEKHDDFGDLMDYIMLDSNEREKHRVEIDRVHPVIQRSMEGDLVKVDNPTIAEMRKIAVRVSRGTHPVKIIRSRAFPRRINAIIPFEILHVIGKGRVYVLCFPSALRNTKNHLNMPRYRPPRNPIKNKTGSRRRCVIKPGRGRPACSLYGYRNHIWIPKSDGGEHLSTPRATLKALSALQGCYNLLDDRRRGGVGTPIYNQFRRTA
ncbi:hypothetical protein GEV33_009723 [Tenebrio molitor]|uniref:Uncharacterized protein n=1 Tax=Tenebrio molitor TaxID=7067 RepID=A0A8J6LBD3_TENMO|nr:hypothetical protein GEV33_009723 [Tenebrio molitor]